MSKGIQGVPSLNYTIFSSKFGLREPTVGHVLYFCKFFKTQHLLKKKCPFSLKTYVAFSFSTPIATPVPSFQCIVLSGFWWSGIHTILGKPGRFSTSRVRQNSWTLGYFLETLGRWKQLRNWSSFMSFVMRKKSIWKKKRSQIFHCRVKITWNSVKKSPGKPGNLLEFHFSKVLTTLGITCCHTSIFPTFWHWSNMMTMNNKY